MKCYGCIMDRDFQVRWSIHQSEIFMPKLMIIFWFQRNKKNFIRIKFQKIIYYAVAL